MSHSDEPAPREDADIVSSSERYQRRFEGTVGRWFLQLQTRLTLVPAPRSSTSGADMLRSPQL